MEGKLAQIDKTTRVLSLPKYNIGPNIANVQVLCMFITMCE